MSVIRIPLAIEGVASSITIGALSEFPIADASAVAVLHDSLLPRNAVEEIAACAGRAKVALAIRPVRAGESLKSHPAWIQLVGSLAAAGLDRSGVVVAAGGGSVIDAAGFAAACWLRGVRWIAVPTTLLAMVDAAIGGKTGINFGELKNTLGAFHLPRAVLVNPEFLATLPEPERRSGWAEILKTALVGDAELFEDFRAGQRGPDTAGEPSVETLARAIAVKCRVVAADYRDLGSRALLNLGHTLGHALEAWGGAGGLRHGEAVAVGLAFAARVARALRLADPALVAEIDRVLDAWRLPRRWDPAAAEALHRLMARDKKRIGGCWRMALPLAPGRVEVHEVDPDLIRRLLAEPR